MKQAIRSRRRAGSRVDTVIQSRRRAGSRVDTGQAPAELVAGSIQSRRRAGSRVDTEQVLGLLPGHYEAGHTEQAPGR